MYRIMADFILRNEEQQCDIYIDNIIKKRLNIASYFLYMKSAFPINSEQNFNLVSSILYEV